MRSTKVFPWMAVADMRLSGRAFLVFGALVGLVIVAATNQIVPASSAHQAQLRVWLAARASGIATYLLLTFQVLVGLVLSHPTNQTTWKLSKRLFPWHEDLLLFVIAFVAVHVVSLVADPYAGVGVGGAFVPGLSSYRSSPVALGTLALYALLVTGLTARYAKRLPSGAWLKLHRLSLVVFALAWLHGMLAGSDSADLLGLYVVSGVLVVMAVAYRYWIVKRTRQRPGHAAAPRAAVSRISPPGRPPGALVPEPAGGVAVARHVPAVGAGPGPEGPRRPIPNEEVA